MSSEGSVSCWISRLQAGDPAAAQELWERYFRHMVTLARQNLAGRPRRAADEEDVALSAFGSFCRNAEKGRFPQLHDRDSLWALLVVITARKASHLLRDESRQKRGGGAEPQSNAAAEAAEEFDLDQLLSREPSPAFAAEVAEECQRLLRKLNDDELMAVALWKMEGHTVDEISERLGYAPRSVKRKLRMIRDLWEKEVVP